MQSNAKLCKARQSTAKQSYAKQGNAKQCKAMQCKAKQGKGGIIGEPRASSGNRRLEDAGGEDAGGEDAGARMHGMGGGPSGNRGKSRAKSKHCHQGCWGRGHRDFQATDSLQK